MAHGQDGPRRNCTIRKGGCSDGTVVKSRAALKPGTVSVTTLPKRVSPPCTYTPQVPVAFNGGKIPALIVIETVAQVEVFQDPGGMADGNGMADPIAKRDQVSF